MFSLVLALCVMFLMWGPKVMDVLYVTLSIFGSWVYGMGVLFSVMLGINVLCCFVTLVMSAEVDFCGATLSLFIVSHCETVSR